MKKLLILNKTLSPGGAERQLVEIAKLLTSRGHKVTFMLNEIKGSLLSEVADYGIEVVKNSFAGHLFRRSRLLRKMLLREHYDTVLSFLPETNLLAGLASLPSKRWKLVTGARSANPSFKKNLKLRLYYYIHQLSDLVITNSETNKRDILEVAPFIKSDKIKVIYNLIRNESPSNSSSVGNGKIRIVVGANYRSVKNLINVIEALYRLSDTEREKMTIDWYGIEIDNTLTDAKKLISKYSLGDTIKLHGSTDDLIKEYNEADWVGLFSRFEGLPNSLCEALVIGKPVICTPISDMPILLSGTQNIVCEGIEPVDLQCAFKRLINVSNQELTKISHENLEKFPPIFSKTKITNELLLNLG